MQANPDSSRQPDAVSAPSSDAPLATAPRPRLPVTWWGLLIRVIAATAALFLANAIQGFGIQPLTAKVEGDLVAQGLIVIAAFAFTCVFIVLFVWAWMRLIERRPLSASGWHLRPSALAWMLAGVAASIVVMAAVVAIGALVLPPASEGIADAGANSSGDGGLMSMPLWLVIAFLLARSFLLQGIPEELLFRGWLFSVTRERPLYTLVWTSLAFAIIHLASDGGQQNWVDRILYLAVPLGFGALAGALVLLTGSMWIAAGVHGGFHVAGALVTVLFPMPAVGAVEWLLIGAVYLVAAGIVLAMWQRRRTRRVRLVEA